jgi:hypothetical protein
MNVLEEKAERTARHLQRLAAQFRQISELPGEDGAKHELEDALFRQYAKMLREEIIEPSEGPVAVEWSKVRDEEGEVLYKLKVSKLADIPGEVETTFASDDLGRPSQMHFLLLHLWSKVLQIRGHKLLQEMYEARDREDRNGSEPI